MHLPVLLDHYKRMSGDDSMREWQFMGALWQLSLWKFTSMAVEGAFIGAPNWRYNNLVMEGMEL